MRFLLFLILTSVVFGQYEDVANKTIDILSREGLIRSNIDKELISYKLNYQLVTELSYDNSDLAYGISQSLISGFALGIYESNAFGYTYPKLPNGDIKSYLRWNKAGDGVFSKILTPQKVFREVDHYADSRAWRNYRKYYASSFWFSYGTHFIFKNLAATVVRDYAKHGELFKSFNIELVLEY